MSKDSRETQAALAAEVEASIQRGRQAQDEVYDRWVDSWLKPPLTEKTENHQSKVDAMSNYDQNSNG